MISFSVPKNSEMQVIIFSSEKVNNFPSDRPSAI